MAMKAKSDPKWSPESNFRGMPGLNADDSDIFNIFGIKVQTKSEFFPLPPPLLTSCPYSLHRHPSSFHIQLPSLLCPPFLLCCLWASSAPWILVFLPWHAFWSCCGDKVVEAVSRLRPGADHIQNS